MNQSEEQENTNKYVLVKDLYRDVVDRYGVRVVMLDLDGVVYRGPRAIAGAAACVNALMRRGVRVLYVTNNAARSGAFFRRKLCALGIDSSLLLAQDAVAPVVYTSGTAAALCLLRRSSPFNQRYARADNKDEEDEEDGGSKDWSKSDTTKKKNHLDVYALAEAGFAEEFAAVHAYLARTAPEELAYATATVHGGAADSARTLDVQGGAEPVVADPAVAAVVVGFDAFANYYKLAYAASCLERNRAPDGRARCPLLVCNTDPVLPLARARPGALPDAPPEPVRMPGAGALVAALLAASGRSLADADTFLCGKPAPDVLWPAVRAHEPAAACPDRVLMVGDSPRTDIRFGRACGVRTMLVLSGNTPSVDAAREAGPDCAPDFVAPSLAVGDPDSLPS